MKRIRKAVSALALAGALYGGVATGEPAAIIFDTDMNGDYDDVGALACLQALADAGEAEILATVSCCPGNVSLAPVELVNRYYGRPDIPLGCVKSTRGFVNRFNGYGLLEKYAGEYRYADSSQAPDSVAVCRRALAGRPDGSVTICTVGYFSGMEALLDSPPDGISPLNGRDLVAKKVKHLVSMACKAPRGRECNSSADWRASKRVMEAWPTPIYFSHYSYGRDIHTGRAVAERGPGTRNPVKDAYANELTAREKCTATSWDRVEGHPSWDLTAVLIAVKGPDCGLFSWRRGRFEMVGTKGEDVWHEEPDGNHRLVEVKAPLTQIAEMLDELMLRPPAHPVATGELRKETAFYQRAIDAAAAAGGGRVTVASGAHLVGPLHLRSNVELHLEKDATLVFSDDPKDCLPAVRVSWEGVECYNLSPLLYAYGATNVAITGKGRLVARMDFWKNWKGVRAPLAQKAWDRLVYEWGEKDVPVEDRRLNEQPGATFRPHFLHFNRCRNVRLEGFTMRGSPFWTIHLFLCDGADVRALDVNAFDETGFAMNNSDGIDIESSRNVRVEGCSFCQNDDGIVLKSGRNRDGRRVGAPTENVTVRDCVVRKGHGLFVIGSEASGGVRNVRMENCRIEGEATRLLYVKTARPRGGFIENVTLRDVTATKVTREVLAINASYMISPSEVRPEGLPAPHIAGVRMENVRCAKAKMLYAIEGDPEDPIDGVELKEVRADSVEAPSVLENATRVTVNGGRLKDPPPSPHRPPHW